MGQYAKVVKKKKKKKTRRLLPEAWEAFIARRIVDITALALLGGGIFILLALASYSHTDPSMNTASAAAPGEIDNWLHLPGAYIADLLIQTIGLGGLVFSIALTVWGLRLWKRQSLRPLWLRFSTMITAALFAAMAFARLPAGEWLLHPYLGGSGGTLLLDKFAALIHISGAPYEHTIAALISAVTALALLLAAAAVRRAEITAAASFSWQTIRISALWLYACARVFYLWVRHHNDPAYASALQDARPKIRREKPAAAPKPRTAPPLTSEDGAAASPKGVRIINKPETTAPSKTEALQTAFSLPQDNGEWELPPVTLLDEVPETTISAQLDEKSLQQNAEMLQNVLGDFNISGEIVSIHPGPVVTLYELEPAPGTKTARVISLSDDIARSMAAVSVRCAVIPGRNVIGIELPNSQRQTVYLREMLESREVQKSKAALPLILGKDIGGHPVTADLTKMPHLLVAGTTGSGKSVAINTMILSLLYRLPPEKCRFIMIDPKMLELSVYDNIPHLLSPVVTEPGKAIVSLKWTVQEMENRYRAMSKLGVRNIEGYNARIRESLKKGETLMRKIQTGFDPDTGKPVFEDQPMDMSELPYIVVVVDEFADLMLVAGKDVENAIQRLAQMARAAGIHLIMATQRPSVDVITGVIKANFPTRVSFSVTSKVDSRTILGEGGAEQLLGLGDMLYMAPGGRITRVHGPFVSDDEVEQVVSFLKEQGEPQYIDEVTEGGDFGESEIMGALFSDEGGGGDDVDELYDQAVAIVAREQKASTSFIQRHLQIGYNRAARIIEEMERQGVVSKATATGKRDVLVSDFSDA